MYLPVCYSEQSFHTGVTEGFPVCFLTYTTAGFPMIDTVRALFN